MFQPLIRIAPLGRVMLMTASLLFYSSFAQASHPQDPKLIQILGVDWKELHSCKKPSDCEIVPSFLDCCEKIAVQKKYAAKVTGLTSKLFEELASKEMKESCSLKECQPPFYQPACENFLCVARLLKAQKNSAQVLKMASDFLETQGLHAKDFGKPKVIFHAGSLIWFVEFGPVLKGHEQRMKEKKRDDSYSVTVQDRTGQTTLNKGLLISD